MTPHSDRQPFFFLTSRLGSHTCTVQTVSRFSISSSHASSACFVFWIQTNESETKDLRSSKLEAEQNSCNKKEPEINRS